MTQKGLTPKTCEKCGAEFICGAAAGRCWCMSVSLERGTLENLRQQYDDCLCETCLSLWGGRPRPATMRPI